MIGESKFDLTTALFHYGLTANELVAYSYLKSCCGSRDACQVKIKTVAAACGFSETTARRALHTLRDRGFLDIKGNAQQLKTGGHRQTCNRYYLLDQSEWKEKAHKCPASVTGEMYQ